MKLYRASELRLFLEELGLDAKKGLSQNFLIDGNILRKIVAAADVHPHDHVIEIGPGPGALTEFLLEGQASVTAVELDADFAKALKRLQGGTSPLQIFQQDFLDFPLEEFFKQQKARKWKVVANLPYHITTPILTKLLPLNAWIDSVTIMVQKEFARRMTAKPQSADYGSFTLFTEFYSHPTYCFTVEPTCFYPRPKVQSAVVHCKLQKPPIFDRQEEFFKLTRSAFQKRRKMLRASLKELFPPEAVENALLDMKLPLKARPEELSLQQFLTLFEKLSS